ncbi:hypothetical protein ACRAWD_24685 [Caulobacter segnis]
MKPNNPAIDGRVMEPGVPEAKSRRSRIDHVAPQGRDQRSALRLVFDDHAPSRPRAGAVGSPAVPSCCRESRSPAELGAGGRPLAGPLPRPCSSPPSAAACARRPPHPRPLAPVSTPVTSRPAAAAHDGPLRSGTVDDEVERGRRPVAAAPARHLATARRVVFRRPPAGRRPAPRPRRSTAPSPDRPPPKPPAREAELDMFGDPP